MSLLNTDPGPDREKIVRSAVTARLKNNRVLDPMRHEDILRAAVRSLTVRIADGRWRVTERDLDSFIRDAETCHPGWIKAAFNTAPDDDGWSKEVFEALPAKERLRLANAGVQYIAAEGRYRRVVNG